MKNIFTFILLIIATITLNSQNWNVKEIGRCPQIGSYDLVLAEGQNDGVQRIYVSTKLGGIYEWTYDNAQWKMTNTVHPGPLSKLNHLAAGKARNDEKVRIYFVEWKDTAQIFEAEWNGNKWESHVIGVSAKAHSGIVIGNGRNDGKERIYISGFYGLNEWTWASNKWNKKLLNTQDHEVSGDIGQYKNDGRNRIIMNSNCSSQLNWSNNTYDQSGILCMEDKWPDAVQIADGRNDGVQRIYVNTTANPGGRKEYSWDGSKWTEMLIDPDKHRGDIHVAKLHADGKNRVYFNNSKYFKGKAGNLFEYEWQSNQWNKTGVVVDAATGATAMMASGYGRNDDTLRMYTPHFVTGGIYEITNKDPYVNKTSNTQKTVEEKTGFVISPNPWLSNELNIHINNPLYQGELLIQLLDINGTVLLGKSINVQLGTRDTKLSCTHCTKGIYIVKIIEDNLSIYCQKIIRL